MQYKGESKDQRLKEWISSHKGFTFSLLFGVTFILLNGIEPSAGTIVMMQTIMLVIIFIGMMIFIYNFGYVIIILAVDEGLNDEERILLKWMVRRAAFISVLWFIGVLALLMFFQYEPFLLAGFNCFLLAFLLFFIRKGENPLTEGTAI